MWQSFSKQKIKLIPAISFSYVNNVGDQAGGIEQHSK